MKRMGRKWLGAVLALTLGLLVFLLIDTLLEAFEVAAALPGAFQGMPLVLFAALLTWLVLLAIGSGRRERAGATSPARRGLYLADPHRLQHRPAQPGRGSGDRRGLCAWRSRARVIPGDRFHAAQHHRGHRDRRAAGVREADRRGSHRYACPRPGLLTFLGLALLAGAPAILGTWIGGFAFSPLLASIFLGMGVGAIWQVIVEVTALLKGYAEREGASLYSWLNVGGFLAGLAIMYLTALLVNWRDCGTLLRFRKRVRSRPAP